MTRLQKFKRWYKKNKYFFLILIVAAVLRFAGVRPGYNFFHSDESVTYGTAVYLIKNDTWDPGRYDYPAPVMVILAVLMKYIFMPLKWLEFFVTHIDAIRAGIVNFPLSNLEKAAVLRDEILGPQDINTFFWSRYITATFGLGNVALLFSLAKKLFGKKTALIAALFLALNFRHVTNSHITLPDIYNSFFLLLSFNLTIRLWRNPNRRNYIWAGLGAGLSLAVKYQVYALFPLVLVHLYLSIKDGKIDFKELLAPYAFVGALCVPFMFLAMNPYMLVNYEEVLRWYEIVVQKYSIGTNTIRLYTLSYIYHIDFGPMLSFATLAGFAMLARKWKKFLIIFLPFLYFLYLFAYSSRGGFYVRNIIPMTPLLLIPPAYFFSYIWDYLTKTYSKLLLAIILCFVLFVPARNSIIHAYYYTKPWNFDVAGDWLRMNVSTEEIIAATPIDVPGGPKLNKIPFELAGNYSLAEQREAGAEFALLNLDWASANFYFWMNVSLDRLHEWNKPLDVMRNMFEGLATEEMFRYQVFSATKPWQSAESNIIIVKIPEWPEAEYRLIKELTFDSPDDLWERSSGAFVFDSEVGNKEKGSLRYSYQKTKSRYERAISDVIPVIPGHLYEISGFLKSGTILSSQERNGFIRVDFYEDSQNLGAKGEISSVSSRIYESDEWQRKLVKERAPENAQYMTVSFQISTYGGVAKTDFWLDDIKVYESREKLEDITKSQPYKYQPIDLHNLYPYSHANL